MEESDLQWEELPHLMEQHEREWRGRMLRGSRRESDVVVCDQGRCGRGDKS